MERHSVRDVADILSITTGAVRSRLSRGTLQSIKEGDTVIVLLPERHTERDTGDIPDERDALISAKDDLIATLHEQLEAERQAHAEARRLLAAALERIPPQLEAPQTASEGPDREESRPSTEGASEQPSRRSWWARLFGG
jgi:hypothetical protein